jgi:cell division protein FtsI/penicillin-binding protein 2
MASYPDFDPNDYADVDPNIYNINPAVGEVYEPAFYLQNAYYFGRIASQSI